MLAYLCFVVGVEGGLTVSAFKLGKEVINSSSCDLLRGGVRGRFFNHLKRSNNVLNELIRFEIVIESETTLA